MSLFIEAEDLAGNIGTSNVISIKLKERPKFSLTGLIKNSIEEVIQGANVSLEGSVNLSVITDETGKYMINELDPGEYTISISKEYYKDSISNITIEESMDAHNIILVLGQKTHLAKKEN